ncbi:hypothetical protein BGW80DRAFT_1219569 [Lactifluus volemus]|nr:hypothetical protein BGW80DRAFT_1219569 [Lactifluus volemus]
MKNLFSQFRHVAGELATKRRKEREGEHELWKSLWAGGSPRCLRRRASCSCSDWMSDLAQQAGMSDDEKDKAERDSDSDARLRWVGDFAGEITAAISLREWDKAVDLVEQGPVLTLRSRNWFLTHPSGCRRSFPQDLFCCAYRVRTSDCTHDSL